jgi:deoxycytidylate deaminase
LKRPEEVFTLRKVYGPGFFLIGVHTSEKERLDYLKSEYGVSEAAGRKLIARDQQEDDPFGQRTRAAFQLADVFVELRAGAYQDQLRRFLDLVFGHYFHTPTRDEHAMFQAYGASLRSADLSRQVGAAIMSKEGEVIAIGCNDVPCFGGGLYWPEQNDQRDHKFHGGFDSNEKERNAIVNQILDVLESEVPMAERKQVQQDLLRRTRISEITEFGRAVHAEMEALLACSRIGVSPSKGKLYTTTFPCHNCTRHIVAAGIEKVIYIEPYPKSRASELHSDSILVKEAAPEGTPRQDELRVVFAPFVGIGPRRYFDLFSVSLSSGRAIERKEKGRAKVWRPGKARPRVPMVPASYLQREQIAVAEIVRIIRG